MPSPSTLCSLRSHFKPAAELRLRPHSSPPRPSTHRATQTDHRLRAHSKRQLKAAEAPNHRVARLLSTPHAVHLCTQHLRCDLKSGRCDPAFSDCTLIAEHELATSSTSHTAFRLDVLTRKGEFCMSSGTLRARAHASRRAAVREEQSGARAKLTACSDMHRALSHASAAPSSTSCARS